MSFMSRSSGAGGLIGKSSGGKGAGLAFISAGVGLAGLGERVG